MINLNYQKNKNQELFKSIENPHLLNIKSIQNYIPIYKRFFNLNENNYNSINLNNNWYLANIKEKLEESNNIFYCRIKNQKNKIKDKEIFFKYAPLLDPFKYMLGKYYLDQQRLNNLFNLPQLNSNEEQCHEKLLDVNNSSYIDALFIYLTNQLKTNNNFIHGLDYYGSYLGIQNNYKVNIFYDLEYLAKSDYFNKYKNNKFFVDDYQHLFNEELKKIPIKIGDNISIKSNFSLKSIENNLYDEIFYINEVHNNSNTEINNINDLNNLETFDNFDNLVDLDIHNNNKNNFNEFNRLINETEFNETELLINNEKNVNILCSSSSSSSCSSRSSHTKHGEFDDKIDDEFDDKIKSELEDKLRTNNTENSENSENNEYELSSDDISSEEEIINATIPQFPIQLIAMENCDATFDSLIIEEDLSSEEWFSALMQVIMILITYQKLFNFTHNDLHTNNIMYNYTDKKYIIYKYDNKYYKVPTFNRLFKIIDFGRSIFKLNNEVFMSDSFKNGGDASTQYNCEPYLNLNKPRLEPNTSFDLCRLACSIFDYLIEDINEVQDLIKIEDPVKKLIVEWCIDDKGMNILYKANGLERYPEFKLYKMIARCVHNHTPQKQLERPEFDAYLVTTKEFKNNEVIDIDAMKSTF